MDATLALEEIVRRAIRLGERERGAFLDEECPMRLRPWVEARLLGEKSQSLGRTVVDGEKTLGMPGEHGASGVPECIGRYRILRLIGTGGMGTVYEAEQDSPRRVVALKVMSPTLASRSAQRRFEYETQVLAELRHPGIAQIYEASSHRDVGGLVRFFSMELVPGALPITRYAEDRELDLRQRLELFVEVCDAVHQALRRRMPSGHWLIASVEKRHGESLMGLGRLDEAEGELLAAYEGLSLALGPDHDRSRAAARALSELYERTGDVGESVRFERLARAASPRSQ